jgi:hypothetical protein
MPSSGGSRTGRAMGALLRSAEDALSAGDRDGATTRLGRAAELAQRLGAQPLSYDIALLARRARARRVRHPKPAPTPLPDRDLSV